MTKIVTKSGKGGFVHTHLRNRLLFPLCRLSTGRLFQLERFRRDLDNCESKDELRKIGHSLLALYFQQQETVASLIDQGWLPPETQT